MASPSGDDVIGYVIRPSYTRGGMPVYGFQVLRFEIDDKLMYYHKLIVFPNDISDESSHSYWGREGSIESLLTPIILGSIPAWSPLL